MRTFDPAGCELRVGDALELLPTLPDGSIDFVATDPPYTVQTQGQYVADPYRYTRSIPPIPPYEPKNNGNGYKWSGTILNPTGVKAYKGDVTISAATTLAAGIYIIVDGSLNQSNSNPLSGTGVTIILTSPTPSTDNGTFGFSGQVNLTAPPTGPTAGIALWADRNLPYYSDNLTGSGNTYVKGAVYLPSHQVKYAGNNQAVTNGCTQIIAWDIIVTGTTNFYHECANVGILDPVLTWGLVE